MRPAIHLPLAQLQTLDLPLHWPRAPRQGAARFDGLIIRPQAMSKALARRKAPGCGTRTPGVKRARLTLTHEPGTVLRQRDRLGAFPRLRLAPSAVLLCVILERGLTSPAPPGGSTRGQRWVALHDGRG
jgi:hypothetical protein